MSTPQNEIPYVPQAVLDPAAAINASIDHMDAQIQTAVLSMALSSPPSSPAEGDQYIVASGASGAWAGHEEDLARYVAEGSFWTFFTAGTQIRLVLNEDDGGLYSFVGSSWAPAIPGSVDGAISVQDQESPPNVIDPASVIVFGDGLTITDLGGGVVLVERTQEFPEVVEEAGTARTALAGDAGQYVRFTNAAAKTYTFNDGNGYTKGQEFHGRNAGTGDLTIVPTTGMTINAPAEGTLVIPEDGTFTVKIVSDDGDEADLFGMTVAV